jgi:O-antigen/teichoic acid export membrane protein
MNEKNYLLSVLGLSAIPRIATSLLTFICFPLMIRSMGAESYGTIIYLMAIISTLESFVDFGVSSAAGKAIAEARIKIPSFLSEVVKKWARLQFSIAIIGFLPLIGMTYLISYNDKTGSHFNLLIILVISSWITIFLNFIRATMNSLLAFKYIAFLDTYESIIRSISWLVVAYFFPNAVGLAWAQLCTAILTVIAASYLVYIVLRKLISNSHALESLTFSTKKQMLKESFNFLWLRLITRIFQSVPIFIFGKLFGAGLVGMMGAFSKIMEIINFPFSIIGNAIAVKVQGVVFNGIETVKKLWDMVSRFLFIAIISSLTIYLGADIISDILLPGNKGAVIVIEILSLSILSNALSSLIAPMSDYVGALKSRNILMTIFTCLLFLTIYFAGTVMGENIALITYVFILLLMNIGYIAIALKAFFKNERYRPKKELFRSFFLIIFSFSLSVILRKTLTFSIIEQKYNEAVIGIILFWVLFLIGIVSIKSLRHFFFTKTFLDIH